MSQKEKSEFPPARAFYAVEDIRWLEKELLDSSTEPGSAMERAGEAAYRWLSEHVEKNPYNLLVVCCGSGGNGGDGLVLARHLHQDGRRVQVLLPKPVKHADTKLMLERAVEAGVSVLADPKSKDVNDMIEGASAVVDCLLGIGGGRLHPSSPYRAITRAMNRGPSQVYALDIPSGIDPDAGTIGEDAVRACATLCMLAPVSGLAGAGGGLAGEISVAELGSKAEELRPRCEVVVPRELVWVERDAHKGTFGHVVIVAGDHGYGGAALLAAEAAAVGGAGLVTLCTRERHASAVLASSPDVMVCTAEVGSDIQGALAKATSIVCGPGLGQEAWGEQMLLESLRAAEEHDIPIVLDADALNLCRALSWVHELPILHGDPKRIHSNLEDLKLVITPHPGEAAKLLSLSVQDVQNDRLDAVRILCESTNAVVVLKGHGTVVANSITDREKALWGEEHFSELFVTRVGNVALARGGSGDVLAGLIGSQLAHRELGDWDDIKARKNDTVMDAVKHAVLAHGQAADELVKEHGIRGVRPRELAATAGKILSDMAYRLR